MRSVVNVTKSQGNSACDKCSQNSHERVNEEWSCKKIIMQGGMEITCAKINDRSFVVNFQNKSRIFYKSI